MIVLVCSRSNYCDGSKSSSGTRKCLGMGGLGDDRRRGDANQAIIIKIMKNLLSLTLSLRTIYKLTSSLFEFCVQNILLKMINFLICQ